MFSMTFDLLIIARNCKLPRYFIRIMKISSMHLLSTIMLFLYFGIIASISILANVKIAHRHENWLHIASPSFCPQRASPNLNELNRSSSFIALIIYFLGQFGSTLKIKSSNSIVKNINPSSFLFVWTNWCCTCCK